MVAAESRVKVAEILSLLAAVILSIVIGPAVASSRPVAVMFCSSAPVRFRPFSRGVSPRPMPVPSESVTVVAARPLFSVPVKVTSLAVMLRGLSAVVTAALTVRVPAPSAS